MKRLIFFPLVLILIFSGCSIKSPDDYYNKIENGELTATVSINCRTAVDYESSKREKAEILSDCKVNFKDGDTVYDALKNACKQNKIQFEYSGNGDSIYIEGIDYLYEFDCGELSGWKYSVNGVFPNKGCNVYKLKDGDEVDWLYTCDLGEDIGDKYEGNR